MHCSPLSRLKLRLVCISIHDMAPPGKAHFITKDGAKDHRHCTSRCISSDCTTRAIDQPLMFPGSRGAPIFFPVTNRVRGRGGRPLLPSCKALVRRRHAPIQNIQTLASDWTLALFHCPARAAQATSLPQRLLAPTLSSNFFFRNTCASKEPSREFGFDERGWLMGCFVFLVYRLASEK